MCKVQMMMVVRVRQRWRIFKIVNNIPCNIFFSSKKILVVLDTTKSIFCPFFFFIFILYLSIYGIHRGSFQKMQLTYKNCTIIKSNGRQSQFCSNLSFSCSKMLLICLPKISTSRFLYNRSEFPAIRKSGRAGRQ